MRLLLCLAVVSLAVSAPLRRRRSADAPSFGSFSQPNPNGKGVQPLTGLVNLVQSTLGRFTGGGGNRAPVAQSQLDPRIAAALGGSLPSGLSGLDTVYQGLGTSGGIDLDGIASGSLPGLAPIPVPGYPGPQDVPEIPGVNTIPGLGKFTYLVGDLIPGIVPSTNKLIGGSIGRLLPQESTKNLAKDIFKTLHPPSANVDVDRMMGRWFQVINSPHVIREACTVSHFGRLTNDQTYSANFTQLKFYREGNPNGPPRFSIAYGFKSGDDGQFVVHSSNSADAVPFWVVAAGPLNEFNQYDYAIISNWVKFPVYVIARDPERFQQQHMHGVLQYLEENNYINYLTKFFHMISPVDYSQCQYVPFLIS